MPPALNFAPLENAVDGARGRGRALQEARCRLPRRRLVGNAAAVAAINAQAACRASSSCSIPPACPNREWYRHLLYAPGFYTGYGVKTHAGRARGDRAAAVDKEAETEIVRAAKALEREAAWLESITKMLNALK